MLEDRVSRLQKWGKSVIISVIIAYSVFVDNTKVARGVRICTGFNAIDGDVFPQHYISLYVKRDDKIKKMIHKVKTD